jgi:patatin-like phospholipase/acyl hydrolase
MMNCIFAAILFTGVDAAPKNNTTDYYNILAIDGGGIRGLISAKVLENIETMAYEYAKSKNYTFPEYPGEKAKGRFAMKDLFNMTAGTSTGSIIAAGLAYPDKNHTDIKMPGFFAPDLLEIYSDRGDEIFVKK